MMTQGSSSSDRHPRGGRGKRLHLPARGGARIAPGVEAAPPPYLSRPPPPPDDDGGGPPPASTHADSDVPPAGQDVDDEQVFYERLAPYGHWEWVPEYGRVWCPRSRQDGGPTCTADGMLTDWGWTWVSDDPVAWAAYHYGQLGFHRRSGLVLGARPRLGAGVGHLALGLGSARGRRSARAIRRLGPSAIRAGWRCAPSTSRSRSRCTSSRSGRRASSCSALAARRSARGASRAGPSGRPSRQSPRRRARRCARVSARTVVGPGRRGSGAARLARPSPGARAPGPRRSRLAQQSPTQVAARPAVGRPARSGGWNAELVAVARNQPRAGRGGQLGGARAASALAGRRSFGRRRVPRGAPSAAERSAPLHHARALGGPQGGGRSPLGRRTLRGARASGGHAAGSTKAIACASLKSAARPKTAADW